MNNKIKKIICVVLALVAVIGIMPGCGDGVNNTEPTVAPHDQLFIDKYERNEDITQNLTFKIDYITNKSYGTGMDILSLFNHTKVQVDGWDSIVMGVSTMGDIVSIINKANDAAGESKPYAYTVTIGKSNKAVPEEYRPTLLIDPSKNNILFFDVTKYGIPYVRFEFATVNGLYNTKITQESDWVANGIGSAYVPYTPDKETGAAPSHVDADGRNKAAKQNIVLSGDIVLGGEGFTWDSLMTMCQALQLNEGSRTHGFVQSSDANFTYYTIVWSTNPYEYANSNEIDYNNFVVPQTRLVATFDPLSQTCLNWTVDTYSAPLVYSEKKHDMSEPISVNVKEYQVDIKNYAAMRETIKDWIIANAESITTKKCVVNSVNEFVNDIEVGKPDNSSIVVNGTKYQRIEIENDADSEPIVKYISDYYLKKSHEIGDANERNAYLKANSEDWKIAYKVFDKKDKMIGIFVEGEPTLVDSNGKLYYVGYYKINGNEYEDLSILSYDMATQLLMVYTKTYRLNAEQNAQIQSVFNENGVLAVKTFVDELFAEAEKEQNAKQ